MSLMKTAQRSLWQDKSTLTETLVWFGLLFIAGPLLCNAFLQLMFWLFDPLPALAH
jgi:hypothetical protein